MPQMAPLSWLFLFMFFLLILSLFNMMNFFCYTLTHPQSDTLKTCPPLKNWKW